MCNLVENYARERAEEAAEEAAQKAAQEAMQDAERSARTLFDNGVSYEVVRTSITSLTDERLQVIYKASKQ